MSVGFHLSYVVIFAEKGLSFQSTHLVGVRPQLQEEPDGLRLVAPDRQVEAGQPVVVVVDGVAPQAAPGVGQDPQDLVPADGGRAVQRGLRPVPFLTT